MNAKFIRDNFGLRLEISGANDNERTLMNELMGLTYHKTAKRGLQILPRPEDKKIVLARPIAFLKKGVVESFGFTDSFYGSRLAFFIRTYNDVTYLLRGRGLMTLYVFNIPIPQCNSMSINQGRLEFYEVGEEPVQVAVWDFSWAVKIVRRIQTADDLERALR
jgi:hypothetical protein